MKKAFLCHASKDNEYVRIVCKHLGRAKVIFDDYSFAPGQDFRSEILRGLEKSSLFVYFVSKNSLDSVWCKFELDEAQKKKINGNLESQIAVIIDRDIAYNDLPKWMQTFKTVIQTRPSQASRDIQALLLSILPPELGRPFVGRQEYQQQLGETLSTTSNIIPRIIVLSGLEGIGRRTYIERAAKDLLGLNLGPYFFIDETHQLDDLYLSLLNETSDLGTRAELADEIKAFSKLLESDKRARIVNFMQILCNDNCLPCLIDRGGMLEDNGKYKEEYSELIKLFIEKEEINYLVIIHKRSPKFVDIEFNDFLFYQKIGPLKDHEARLLLNQLLRKAGVKINPNAIEEITSYLDGYPPAAYFSASFAKIYGFDCLINDKSLLNDFKARRFLRFINNLNFSEEEWLVLRYLASEQMLPLSTIAVALEMELEKAAVIIMKLIDFNLVIMADDCFVISAPITSVIFRIKHHLSIKDYEKIREKLTLAFWNKENVAPTIEIVDATLHAVARSGSTDFDPYRDLVRVSTVHKLAQECYHRKEWDQSLEYAKRAEIMDSTRSELRAIHYKSLVQLERWKRSLSNKI